MNRENEVEGEDLNDTFIEDSDNDEVEAVGNRPVTKEPTSGDEEVKPAEERTGRKSKADPSRPASKTSKVGKYSTTGETLGSKLQQLFLVEFLVDTVTIDTCSVDEEVLEGQTCLSLKFLNFPPMEICERDFDPNREQGLNKIKFNCGKSLMFAFNENQCDHPPPLSLEITVSKTLEDGGNSCKVDIGTIKVCVSELFKQIVEIAKFKPDRLPASKSIKDCFMLIGPGKRTMGEVSVYIRLSCLGQNVVTEFQCGPDLKTSPVLFKSREGKKAFEFTGNEPREEGETSPLGMKNKPGCGCIPPSNLKGGYRGQGDAGRSSPPAGGVYAKGNRVVLDLPEKSKQKQQKEDRPRVDKCGDGKPMFNVRNESKTNANPDQNTFVLRVGDKGQIQDRGKMILEFKTPKQRILPKILPPYHEDIAVQTDSRKKGKGKKGKNKK